MDAFERGLLIGAERSRQISMGYDLEHDRKHGVDHLLRYAEIYFARGTEEDDIKGMALVRAARVVMVGEYTVTVLDQDYFSSSTIINNARELLNTLNGVYFALGQSSDSIRKNAADIMIDTDKVKNLCQNIIRDLPMIHRAVNKELRNNH